MWEKLSICLKNLFQLSKTVACLYSLIYALLQHFNFCGQVAKEFLYDDSSSLLYNIWVDLIDSASAVAILLKSRLEFCLKLFTDERGEFDSHKLFVIDTRVANNFTFVLHVADVRFIVLRTEFGTIKLFRLLLLLVYLLVTALHHLKVGLLLESSDLSVGTVVR